MLPTKTETFVFDPEQDEFIGSDADYHFIANDRFMRYGKRVHKVKSFCLIFIRNGNQKIKPSLQTKTFGIGKIQKKETKLDLYS